MNIFKARKTFNYFTPQQKQFIRSRRIEEKISVRKWMHLLEPLCRFDESCDKVRGKAVAWCIFTGIAVIVSLLVLLYYSGFKGPLGILFGLTLFLFLFCLVTAYRFRSMDINNNVRHVVYPILQILSLEVGLKKPVAIKMNFNKELDKKDVVSKNTRGLFGLGDTFYEYEIIDLQCSLMDNTKLKWTVIDKIRKRVKKNPRGKIKTKLKLKRRVLTQLSFDRERYRLKSRPDNTIKTGKNVKLSDGRITIKSMFKQSADGKFADIDLDKLVETVSVSYQFLEAI